MQDHKIVSKEQWLSARRQHLAKEKEFSRLRDELSKQRRELPWTPVDKKYTFDGPDGKESLADLFGKHNQLIVYHFMYGPDWEEGCPSCSFWADNFNDIIVHLNHRNISMVAVARADLATLDAYKKRMGWDFNWVSSIHSDFNYDYQVSFTPEQMEQGTMLYNYQNTKFPASEGPGISVFFKDLEQEIFHTYSCYARGLDMLNGAYHLMDLTPNGRDEDDLPYSMAWLRRHDQYD